ncbi:MAG: hypothetical protein KGN01_07480 [Patescibacteria group bacterium]|nr:hypothetical protein [Patescibacteria group bacterium]
MTRKWGPAYNWVYRTIVLKQAREYTIPDGEICYICKHKSDPLGRTKLFVEHKDNDPANYSEENLGLAHRSCNTRKNPRGPLPQNALPTERERESINTTLARRIRPRDDDAYSNRKNYDAEGPFRRRVFVRVKSGTAFTYKQLKGDACEFAGVNPVTGDRYMEKLFGELIGPLVEATLPENPDGEKYAQFRDPVYYYLDLDLLCERFPPEGQRFVSDERRKELDETAHQSALEFQTHRELDSSSKNLLGAK